MRATASGRTAARLDAATPEKIRGRIMLLKMVGQGLLAGAIVAALAYSYQIYREVGIDGSFVAAQDGDE